MPRRALVLASILTRFRPNFSVSPPQRNGTTASLETKLSHLQQDHFEISVSFLSCKMRQIELVEIFCDVNLDQYDRAIGESLTNLAFEAVEKIIKVSFTLISPGDSHYPENGLILISF